MNPVKKMLFEKYGVMMIKSFIGVNELKDENKIVVQKIMQKVIRNGQQIQVTYT